MGRIRLVSQRFDCRVPAQRRRGLSAAIAALRRGALVVIPADSSYALAGDAFPPEVTDAVRSAKDRPAGAGLPVLVGSAATFDGIAHGPGAMGRLLMAALWPGPLTAIAWQQPSLSWDVDPSGRVAVRQPIHPVALGLLRDTGPLVALGANRTHPSVPLTCDEAEAEMGDLAAVYLDAGPLAGGEGSAVIDMTVDPPSVLRAGSVGLARLQEVCPELDVRRVAQA